MGQEPSRREGVLFLFYSWCAPSCVLFYWWRPHTRPRTHTPHGRSRNGGVLAHVQNGPRCRRRYTTGEAGKRAGACEAQKEQAGARGEGKQHPSRGRTHVSGGIGILNLLRGHELLQWRTQGRQNEM